jgi:hypothetical protein
VRRIFHAAVGFCPLCCISPAIAQEEGNVDDFGVMGISLKNVVKPTLAFQVALLSAGTPNQAGIGGFLPLSINDARTRSYTSIRT